MKLVEGILIKWLDLWPSYFPPPPSWKKCPSVQKKTPVDSLAIMNTSEIIIFLIVYIDVQILLLPSFLSYQVFVSRDMYCKMGKFQTPVTLVYSVIPMSLDWDKPEVISF